MLVEVVVGRHVELSVVVLVGKLLLDAVSGRQWGGGGLRGPEGCSHKGVWVFGLRFGDAKIPQQSSILLGEGEIDTTPKREHTDVQILLSGTPDCSYHIGVWAKVEAAHTHGQGRQ